MAPRREILDSDEDDDDFSPVKDPVAPPLLNQGNGYESDGLETPRNRRAESTDPSFFRNVYDDQNVAANAQQSTSSIAALSSELVSTFSPNPPPNLGHVNEQHDPSHLSSITDPVPASQRRQKKPEMKEVVDLTQVTTPGRPTPSVPTDIWDFPASPDAGASAASSSVNQTASTKKKITIKLKKAETKRKSGLSSSIQSPEEISSRRGPSSSVLLPALSVTQAEQTSDAASPGPLQKRRRISSSGQPVPNSQEVDLLIIPQSEDKLISNNYVTPTGNPSSIVEDSLKARSTSLMVVPTTTLTASQKDEYAFVSLSSEADGSHEHLVLPNAFGQAEDLHKSSGSATIKYPTPIEYASSGRRGPHPGDYGTASSSRPKRRRNVVNSDPPSSPDIISAPAVTPREKGASDGPYPRADDPYLAPSSPPPRSTRRSRKGGAVPDELLSPASAIAENERPRSSGRTKTPLQKRQEHDLTAPSSSAAAKAGDGTKGQPADDLADFGALEPEEEPRNVQEEPPHKKARGRKRKEAPSEAVVEQELPDTALPHPEEEPVAIEARATEVEEAPAPKKRRGRPRKEPQNEAIVIEEGPDDTAPAPDEALALPVDGEGAAPTSTGKKKRGRPRKSDVAKSVDIDVVLSGHNGEVQQDEEGYNDTENGRHISRDKTSRKAMSKTTSGEDEKAAALSERDSNSNLVASPTKPTTTTREAFDNTAKENQPTEVKAKKEVAKEEAKTGTPSSQLGKVQYRVGLSKKSRIAPLLKSFRK